MERLKEVISALNRADILKIRAYYKSREDKSVFRRWELFELVRKGKAHTDVEAAHMLYKSAPNSAFSHLKSRLLEDILEVMLMNAGELAAEEHEAFRTACRKRMVVSEVLIRKGIMQEGLRNLKVAAQIAWKHRLSTEQLLVEEFLGEYFPGETVSNLLGEVTKENVRGLTHLLIARIYFKSSIYNHAAFYENLGELADRLQTIREIEFDLRKAFEEHPTEELRFWYLNFSITSQRLKGNLDLAYHQALEAARMVWQYPEQFSATGRRSAYMNLALLQMERHQWPEATNHLHHLLTAMDPEDAVGHAWSELLFRTLYFAGYRSQAWELVAGKLQEAQHIASIPVHRWEFYAAVWHAGNGDFYSATQSLQRASRMLADKTYGADLGYRHVEIILLMRSAKWDLAQIKLEAFQQLLKRRNDPWVHRYRLMARRMTAIIRYAGYGVPKTKSSTDDLHKLASGEDRKWTWDPLGFELITTSEWFGN